MRLACFLLFFGLSLAAHAEDDEFGVRYWYSEGRTLRSHNAQGVDPRVGNPTSVLTWTELEAHALELHGRKNFGQGGFVKGNAGFGDITGGSLRDEDFNRGQVKFSDTTTTIKGDSLTYVSIDVGSDLWRWRNGKAGLFIGGQFWREQVEGFGVVQSIPPPVRVTVPGSRLVISNEVTLHSLRVGFAGTWNLGAATRIALDAALVPYAHGRDEDSHFLRQSPNDLGPVPNIHSSGNGYGAQLDAELRHLVTPDWEIGAGLRYWWLRARDGEHQQAGLNLQLLELESQRFGLILSVTHRW